MISWPYEQLPQRHALKNESWKYVTSREALRYRTTTVEESCKVQKSSKPILS
jgi:hypothetical protein